MSIKINKMELYATPESQSEITSWIELHSPESRVSLFTVMGMTWNFIANAVSDAEEYGGDSAEHLGGTDKLERLKTILAKSSAQMDEALTEMERNLAADSSTARIAAYAKQQGKYSAFRTIMEMIDTL